jgi:hypothetical protein
MSSNDSLNETGTEVDRRDRAGPQRLTRRRASLAVTAVLAVLVLVAGACSSSPKNPGVAGGGPTTAAAAASSGGSSGVMGQFLAYARCMRSHGISDFPDPSTAGGGIGFSWQGGPGSDLNPNNPRFEAAKQGCQSLLPGGLSTPHRSKQQIAEEVKLAACMRSHGFPSFADPNSQGAFDFSGIDRSSQQFESAMQTCESVTGFSGPLPVEQGPSTGGNS